MVIAMDIKSVLFALAGEDCITGGDEGAAHTALALVKESCPEAHYDALGNIVAPFVPPSPGGEHILLEAHLDEIGFMVTSVDADGFLRVGKSGGPDLRILLGHEVRVHGQKTLPGVFCCRPPHLASKDEYKKVPEPSELAVDIGLTHDEACALVAPGDCVFLSRTPAKLLGGLVTGKAFDNRAGVTAVLRCLELLRSRRPDVGVTALFSLSEELGFKNAGAGAFAAAPTQALVFDVSFALTPDSPREKCGEFFKGPMIGVSPILSNEVTAALFETAKAKGIPYQTEVMPGGTGTNSDAVAVAGPGVKTGLLSIPLRYMHTAAEVIAPEDIESTGRLAAEYILDAAARIR